MNMNGDNFDPEVQQIVRRYSLFVAEENPDDTLSQALAANVECEIANDQRRRGDPDRRQGQLSM